MNCIELSNCRKLYIGSIVVLSRLPDTKWVLQLGYYRYEGEMRQGWYFLSIPDMQIIPVVASDLKDIQILDNGEYCNCTCDDCCEGLHKPQAPCSVLTCPFIDGNHSVEQYVPGSDYKRGQLVWLNPGTLYQAVNDFTASENDASAAINFNNDIKNGNLRMISGSVSSSGVVTFAFDFQEVLGTDNPEKQDMDLYLLSKSIPIEPTSGIAFYNTSNRTYYEYFLDNENELVFMQVTSGDISVHQPIIQSGTWWIYDITTNRYIDTEQPAIGKDGREIQLRATETDIEWRYEGDTEWSSLISTSSLVGAEGDSAYDIAVKNGYTGTESTVVI